MERGLSFDTEEPGYGDAKLDDDGLQKRTGMYTQTNPKQKKTKL